MGPAVFSEICSRTPRRPQALVLLPPGDLGRQRFVSVIAPAVAALSEHGFSMEALPFRIVATFASFERVLSAIAESRLVLADLTPIGEDAKTGAAYRDGDLMCVVGAAVACRHPRDVLLLRQEGGPLPLGYSMLPLTAIDFLNVPAARQVLTENLRRRLSEPASDAQPVAAQPSSPSAPLDVPPGEPSNITV